jgi:hypothetical protein
MAVERLALRWESLPALLLPFLNLWLEQPKST